ncbi:MAG: hypothetical protein CME65_12190 [Halobacteriovoraceae bacterium]|nr:hypothetical protein [Halobacteriovoraceae bacterium]|tara:strand:- start:351 stop:665 length:315 start_codon:yes stop_codon:yes gene_type:complete
MEGKWLSIIEYANFKKKSISTVRRYIKANRVKFKEEQGKYFIFCKNYVEQNHNDESMELKLENIRLKKENRALLEEISELKMLVDLYEGSKTQSKPLPSIPAHL